MVMPERNVPIGALGLMSIVVLGDQPLGVGCLEQPADSEATKTTRISGMHFFIQSFDTAAEERSRKEAQRPASLAPRQ